MDYSAINHVIYRIKLPKEMFVIGGTFAAGLTEPSLAKAMGGGGEQIKLFVSSSNFEVLKNYTPDVPRAVLTVEDDQISLRDGHMHIVFHRGLPQSWVNESGYQVQHPVPLKHWLDTNGYESWAVLMQDTPFEKRMEGWVLTEEEAVFKEECSRHDWYSDYSDDFSVVKNGKVGLNVLLARRDVIGGKAREIFAHYSNR
jgi:hypothetical protein